MNVPVQDYAHISRELGVTHSPAMCRALIEVLRPDAAACIADFGAGSCGDAAFIAQATGAKVICIDVSAEMLALAPHGVWPVRGDARALPLGAGALDAGYALNLLHLLPDLAGLLREFRRVLRAGGCLALPLTSPEQVRTRFVNRFFPSLADVDLERFVSIDRLKLVLAECGFADVDEGAVDVGPVRIDASIVQRMRSGIFSGLGYLTQRERDAGLNELEAFVARSERTGEWAFEHRVRKLISATAS